MFNFLNFSIRKKLFFSFAILFLIVLIFIGGGVYKLREVQEITSKTVPLNILIGDIEQFSVYTYRLDVDIDRFFVIGGPLYKESINDDLKNMESLLDSFKENEFILPDKLNLLENSFFDLKQDIENILSLELMDLSSKEINIKILTIYSKIEKIKKIQGEIYHEAEISFDENIMKGNKYLSKMVNQAWIAAVIIFIFGTFISFFLSKVISNPIIRLSKLALDVGQGNLDKTIPVKSKDELGMLASTFNQMIRDLRKSRKKLENYNKTLEKQVEERTRQLNQKVKEAEYGNIAMLNMMEDADETNRRLLKVQKQLNKYVEELKKMDKKKDEFISIAAHELKTPLTSIRGFASLLKNPAVAEDPVKRKKFFEIIQTETFRLEKLINDILDLSRIDLNTLKFNFEKKKINDILRKVKEQMGVIVKSKGVRFLIEKKGDLPIIEVDEERLIQVLSNLINNAVKYTTKGYIKLRVSKQGDFINFEVIDTGLGIPKEEQKRIFDRFYQVDSSYTRKVGGSGLGLAICKGIIEAIGGKIWVESKLNKGSTFGISIPIKRKPKKKSEYLGLFQDEPTIKEVSQLLGGNLDSVENMITLIIRKVKKIIGPTAITTANQIENLKVDKDGKIIKIEGDRKEILSKLVKVYETFIGPINKLL